MHCGRKIRTGSGIPVSGETIRPVGTEKQRQVLLSGWRTRKEDEGEGVSGDSKGQACVLERAMLPPVSEFLPTHAAGRQIVPYGRVTLQIFYR